MSRAAVVLQLISNLKVGGAQRVVVSLSNELVRQGHEVVVVTLGDSGPLRDELLDHPRLHVHHLRMRRHSVLLLPLFLISVSRILWRLVRILRVHRVGVVQTHMGDSNLLGVLAAVLARVPKRFPTYHSLVFLARTGRDDLRNRFARRTLRGFARLCTRAVAISDAVRLEVIRSLGLPPERVVTLRNGVDLVPPAPPEAVARMRAELGLLPREIVVGCVGRLSRAKGQAHLLRAVRTLVERHPDLVVLLVGDGEDRGSLESLCDELGLRPHVRFLGFRRDVSAVLSVCRVFVLPSEWEGLPVALLEALSAGLPSVATAVAGSKEVLRDGESGLLVPPGDPAALAAAIAELLEDPERARRLAARGRADVEAGFGMPAVCRKYVALYAGEDPSSFS